MAEIKFSPEATNDLLEIRVYITAELCNEQAAQSTVYKIMKRLQNLEQFPKLGASLESIIGFSTDYRFLVCGNYTAFYRIENNTVYIVRILYGRRDFVRILFGTVQSDEGN